LNYFSTIFGLITAADPGTENGGLFLAHYFVLRLMLGMPMDPTAIDTYYSKMYNAYVAPGLYRRSKNHTDRTVSHDEITGFMVGSEILRSYHRDTIWKHLISNHMSYNATGTFKAYNPADYYPWALIAGSSLAPIYAPFYFANLMISSNKPKEETSSKLIYLTELYVIKDKSAYANFLWKYFSWRMEKMYGKGWVGELYAIYFKNEHEDFPLRKLSREVAL